MIPKVLHQVWFTSTPIKAPELRASFVRHNPRWNFMFWDEENLAALPLLPIIRDIFLDDRYPYVVRGDLARFTVLYHCGGIYADMDMLCVKSLDPLLDTQGFSSYSYEGQAGNGLIGCVPQYGLFGEIMHAVKNEILKYADPRCVNPLQVSIGGVQTPLLFKAETIHPCHFFQPFKWTDTILGRSREWPDSYTVHQWHGVDPDGWVKKRF